MVRKIVLSIATVLLFVGFAAAQNKQVSGTVTGPDGSPIAGASVAVEGTSLGTTTDIRGGFALAAPTNGTLIVTFVGYKEEQVAINGKTTVNVVMQEETTGIEDVIVVAFGEAKKEAFTGSAAVLKSEDITKSQTTNALNALNGRVSGVQIMNSTGQPGNSSPSILVRGVSSIYSGKSPLIVLDGMPYDGDLDTINPSDIESMTVLKDAASNALYGARGANGVIMITTKRAKSRDAIVNVDIKVGVNQRAQQDYDYITSPGAYYEQHYKALKNYYVSSGSSNYAAHVLANRNLCGAQNVGGLGYNVYTVPDGQTLIGLNGKLNPNATLGRSMIYNGEEYFLTPDNWTDEIYANGVRQEYNVNISASNDKSNFYASFGYLNNDGIVAKTGYERYTARLRADYQAKKWLKVGANASYIHYASETTNTDSDQGDGQTGSSGNVFAYSSQIAPIYPLYVRNGDGSIKRDQYGHIIYDYGTSTRAGSNAGLERPFLVGTNGYADHMFGEDSYSGNAATFGGFGDVTFLKDFKLTVNGSIYLNSTSSRSIADMFYSQSAPSGGSMSRSQSETWTYNLQQLLSYNKQIGKHNVGVLLGHENYYRRSQGVSGYKTGLFSEFVTELPGVIKTVSASSSFSEYNNEGYFLRAQYDFDSRVFVSGSYRRDASSMFHPDHRWGNFWSLGAAWLINKESWFNAKWVDELKVKASYGSQGNDNIYSYLYSDMFSIKDDGQGEWGAPFYRKGNPDITWETNGNFNAGVEFAFFGDRLFGSAEYFYRKTTDMIAYVSVPPSLGYTGYYKNVGDMVNQGLEVELTGIVFRKKNFSWDINLNVSYVKNEVAKLAEQNKGTTAYSLDGKEYKGFSSGSNFYGEGLPIYSKYMKAFAGVDATTGESLYYVRGKDGELTTTTKYADATTFVHETSLPDVYGGFGTTLNFYGFDLSVNFAYQIGGKIYDSGYASAMTSPTSSNSRGGAYHKDLLKSWTPENPNSEIPRFQYLDLYSASTSNRFLTDGSYLSLQNINFGYTLPNKWMSKIGVSKLRIYLACENVWLWSQRKGLDPRQSYTGSTSAAFYSPIRTISGGINLTF